MPGNHSHESRIVASLTDRSWDNLHAATDGHHLTIGPGPEQTDAWIAAGLELPDLAAMRQYRVDRTVAQLEAEGYDGMIVLDPMNNRYVSDTTNMQLWVMHNATRYAWIGTDGHVIVWDYTGCEFLSGHSHVIAEVRPAIGINYFSAGDRRGEQIGRWSTEMIELITERHGAGARIAIDGAPIECYRNLEAAGITIGDGQRVHGARTAHQGTRRDPRHAVLSTCLRSRDERDARCPDTGHDRARRLGGPPCRKHSPRWRVD